MAFEILDEWKTYKTNKESGLVVPHKYKTSSIQSLEDIKF
jgi:hypothetical protein